MALTVTSPTGDNIGGFFWRYINEPLIIDVSESDPQTEPLNVEMTIERYDGSIQNFNVADYELNSDSTIRLDVSQIFRSIIYRDRRFFVTRNDINQFQTTRLPKILAFKLQFFNDPTGAWELTPQFIYGGRTLYEYGDLPSPIQITNDFQLQGVEPLELNGYPNIETVFNDPSQSVLGSGSQVFERPSNSCNVPCAVVWRSAYGGYNTFGFSKLEINDSFSNKGEVERGYETVDTLGSGTLLAQNIDYISKEYTRRYSVSALNIPIAYLKVLESVQTSEEIYIILESNQFILELCKLSTASIPIDNLKKGGRASLTLESLNYQRQYIK